MDLDDAYRVDRVLARGTGGATEIVTLGESGPFVRKRIPSKLARRGVWGTLAECDCARLPHVIATYEMPDEFVVVCDFVPGENLEQLLSARGRLAEKDATRLVLQLCEAATALHTHGIIHRDISPTNVIVAADGAHMKRQLEIRQSVRVRSADDLDFSHDFLSFASIVIKMHQKCYFCF